MLSLKEMVEIYAQGRIAAEASKRDNSPKDGNGETAAEKQFNEICSLIYCQVKPGKCSKVSWDTFRSTPLPSVADSEVTPPTFDGIKSWVESYLKTELAKAGGAGVVDAIVNPGSGSQGSGAITNYQGSGSFFSKIPQWGWITGGIVVAGGLLGLIAVATKPKKKPAAGPQLSGYRKSKKRKNRK